jgi:hypothetical protein
MKRTVTRFLLCLDNCGNEASLIPGKVYRVLQVYRVLPDARAARDHMVRVIDESGEDYPIRTRGSRRAPAPTRSAPAGPRRLAGG